jgi:hypothetical protein
MHTTRLSIHMKKNTILSRDHCRNRPRSLPASQAAKVRILNPISFRSGTAKLSICLINLVAESGARRRFPKEVVHERAHKDTDNFLLVTVGGT